MSDSVAALRASSADFNGFEPQLLVLHSICGIYFLSAIFLIVFFGTFYRTADLNKIGTTSCFLEMTTSADLDLIGPAITTIP